MIKKTKIVATIGPATESEEMLTNLLKAGLNVMRLNFSHGDFAEHQARVDNFRNAMKNTGLMGAILQDLSGPKIRLGQFGTETVELVAGENITITTESITGDKTRVSINYPNFPKEVKVGDLVMVDDGKKKFQITAVAGNEVTCTILIGGTTKGRRGVNLPSSELSVKSLTEKDMTDIEFGIKNNVDFFALSFVRKPSDIIELREILKARNCDAYIIAKIETPQAIANIDEIISLADGIMVARGDLAIEVPYEKVPILQKMMIEKCSAAGKPIITATQMLESMIKSPVATRAEVSDVANAILDGTDAVMLSEETTLGLYPIEAVTVMSNIALEIEKDYPEREIIHGTESGEREISDSITASVVRVSRDVGAKVIVAMTESGFSARLVSRHKPKPLILCFSPNERTTQRLSLSFGCIPTTIPRYETIPEAFDTIREYCLEKGLAKKGDKVVIAAGVPFNKEGISTNAVTVETL